MVFTGAVVALRAVEGDRRGGGSDGRASDRATAEGWFVAAGRFGSGPRVRAALSSHGCPLGLLARAARARAWGHRVVGWEALSGCAARKVIRGPVVCGAPFNAVFCCASLFVRVGEWVGLGCLFVVSVLWVGGCQAFPFGSSPCLERPSLALPYTCAYAAVRCAQVRSLPFLVGPSPSAPWLRFSFCPSLLLFGGWCWWWISSRGPSGRF